jgi:hypothetical protein
LIEPYLKNRLSRATQRIDSWRPCETPKPHSGAAAPQPSQTHSIIGWASRCWLVGRRGRERERSTRRGGAGWAWPRQAAQSYLQRAVQPAHRPWRAAASSRACEGCSGCSRFLSERESARCVRRLVVLIDTGRGSSWRPDWQDDQAQGADKRTEALKGAEGV